MASSTSFSPPDDAVLEAIRAVKETNSDIGVAKLQTAILTANPTWTLSEKRIRKLLKPTTTGTDAPVAPNAANQKTGTAPSYPISKLNGDLNVEQWTKKVQVKQFGKARGKGLVAKEDIAEGEVIWKEEPFIYSPLW